MDAPKPFLIRFTKRVVFRDMHGTVTYVFEIGDTTDATADAGHYWVASPGGIYKDEAVRVDSEK